VIDHLVFYKIERISNQYYAQDGGTIFVENTAISKCYNLNFSSCFNFLQALTFDVNQQGVQTNDDLSFIHFYNLSNQNILNWRDSKGNLTLSNLLFTKVTIPEDNYVLISQNLLSCLRVLIDNSCERVKERFWAGNSETIEFTDFLPPFEDFDIPSECSFITEGNLSHLTFSESKFFSSSLPLRYSNKLNLSV
jgi:hypothetical protein